MRKLTPQESVMTNGGNLIILPSIIIIATQISTDKISND